MTGKTPSVLHLSTHDRRGGAARAAYRLHRGLIGLGIGSRMAVQVKSSDDPSITAPESRAAKLGHEAVALIDRVPLALYRKRAAVAFDVQWIGTCPASLVSRLRPDLLHLHWVTGGFLRIESLRKLDRPLVWTLCDMWPFTGGCHVSGDCDRYRSQCGACWQLGSGSRRDLTYWVWRRKERAWRGLHLNLVAPSTWMAACARSSSLFRDQTVTVIPNGVDTSVFKPLDQSWARSCLGIEPGRRVILFGAVNAISDANKGMEILQRSIACLAREPGTAAARLVIFGSGAPAEPPRFDLDATWLGHLADETSMALAYNAADLLVVPSRQESFCQTAAEALACGTPVVAFDTTGLRDVVDHQVDGYLAQPYDAQDLANGITSILASDSAKEMAMRARRTAIDRFSMEKVAGRYADLYRQVLAS